MSQSEKSTGATQSEELHAERIRGGNPTATQIDYSASKPKDPKSYSIELYRDTAPRKIAAPAANLRPPSSYSIHCAALGVGNDRFFPRAGGRERPAHGRRRRGGSRRGAQAGSFRRRPKDPVESGVARPVVHALGKPAVRRTRAWSCSFPAIDDVRSTISVDIPFTTYLSDCKRLIESSSSVLPRTRRFIVGGLGSKWKFKCDPVSSQMANEQQLLKELLEITLSEVKDYAVRIRETTFENLGVGSKLFCIEDLAFQLESMVLLCEEKLNHIAPKPKTNEHSGDDDVDPNDVVPFDWSPPSENYDNVADWFYDSDGSLRDELAYF